MAYKILNKKASTYRPIYVKGMEMHKTGVRIASKKDAEYKTRCGAEKFIASLKCNTENFEIVIV